MRSALRFACALAMIANLGSGLALGDGMFAPRRNLQALEKTYISEPDQKAAILFSKGTEDLIISPSYEGEVSSFAWVIPVPSIPKVSILKGALFHELMSLTPEYRASYAAPGGPKTASLGRVQVLERKVVGSYDVSVLKSNEAGALEKWLKDNGYRMPEPDAAAKAIDPVRYYVDKGWTFVACRIETPEKAKGLRTGTLAPLRLTFKTDKPIYPLRMSSLNSGKFSLLIYVLVPTAEAEWPARNGFLQATRPPAKEFSGGSFLWATPQRAYVAKGQSRYPTLARLSSHQLEVFIARAKLSSSDCVEDVSWDLQRQPVPTLLRPRPARRDR